jgi:hypothetical protein
VNDVLPRKIPFDLPALQELLFRKRLVKQALVAK